MDVRCSPGDGRVIVELVETFIHKKGVNREKLFPLAERPRRIMMIGKRKAKCSEDK